MVLGLLISNPFDLINVWKKVSIMAKHATHGTWVVGPNILSISWCPRVGIILMLLWWLSRRGFLFYWFCRGVCPDGCGWVPLGCVGYCCWVDCFCCLVVDCDYQDQVEPFHCILVGLLGWYPWLWCRRLMVW
jgi:hypothetical protein